MEATRHTTILCDKGFHGTTERRWMNDKGFQPMYTGKCAGTVLSVNGSEAQCDCVCHTASKLELRIMAQRHFNISSAAWWKLTDEEQAALIREATDRPITWMCEHGHHGTPERRYSTISPSGVPSFDGMYTGACAGSYVAYNKEIDAYEQGDCSCDCHKEEHGPQVHA